MPSFQFIEAYLNDEPAPLVDYGVIFIRSVKPKSWGQIREIVDLRQEQIVKFVKDMQRIYTFQVDIFGNNALENIKLIQQYLDALLDNDRELGMKGNLGEILDKTYIMDNSRWMRYYSFDFELFIVDTIELNAEMYLKKGVVEVVNRGNSYHE
jgi:hypothetical protein